MYAFSTMAWLALALAQPSGVLPPLPIPASALTDQPGFAFELRLDLAGALATYEALASERLGEDAAVAHLRAARLGGLLHGPARAGYHLRRAAFAAPEHGDAALWLLRAAAHYESAGEPLDAARAVAPLLGAEAGVRVAPEIRQAALVLRARLDLATGRLQRARESLQQVVTRCESRVDSLPAPWNDSCGEAGFRLVRLMVERLDWSYRFRPGEGNLQVLLENRLRAVASAEHGVMRVFPLDSPAWSARALVELGKVYARLARWLWEFPLPPLRPEEREIYRFTLENHIQSIYERAAQSFEKATELVATLHVAAEAGTQARRELFRLRDDLGSPPPPWWLMSQGGLGARSTVEQAAREARRVQDELAEAPGSPDALVRAAEAMLGTGHPDRAAYILEDLVPDGLDRRMLLIKARRTQDDLEGAYALAWELVRQHPHHLGAWCQTAELLFAFGDLVGASKALAGIAEHRPTDPAARIARGVALYGLGQPEHARRLFEKVLEEDPGSPAAHLNLGVIALYPGRENGGPDPGDRLEQLRAAVRHLKTAAELARGDRPVRELLGRAEWELLRLEDAQKVRSELREET